MNPTSIALLALCLCLPLMGAEKKPAKPTPKAETPIFQLPPGVPPPLAIDPTTGLPVAGSRLPQLPAKAKPGEVTLMLAMKAYEAGKYKEAIKLLGAELASKKRRVRAPGRRWILAGPSTQSEILERNIRQSLQKPAGELTKADLEKVTQLALVTYDIQGGSPDFDYLTDEGLEELAKLTRLEQLVLDYTQITDLGLKELAKLPQLTKLGLIGLNYFDKAWVYDSEKLRLLIFLDLWPSKISVTGFKEVAKLKQLKVLRLSGTWITDAGLKEVAKLTKLELLSLDEPGISGAGLKELAKCKQLRVLDLVRCYKINDESIKELAKLKQLKVLRLGKTQITSAGLVQLNKLLPNCNSYPYGRHFVRQNSKVEKEKPPTQSEILERAIRVELKKPKGELTRADLEKMKRFPSAGSDFISGSWGITDEGLKEVTKLTRLERLEAHALDRTHITDVGLRAVAKLKNLTVLELGGTLITDAGLKEVTKLSHLTSLGLGGTLITDAGLKEVTKLSHLTSLGLDATQITDAGLKEMAKLSHLTSLNLNDTKVTKAGVAQLQQALPKCIIVSLVKDRFKSARYAWARGKYKIAIMLLERELAAGMKKAKPDESRVANLLGWLGYCYYDAELSPDKALEYSQKALAIKLKELGSNHPGGSGRGRGNSDRGSDRPPFTPEQIAEWRKRQSQNADVARDYTLIGRMHYDMGNTDKALEYYQKGLAFNLKELGSGHHGTPGGSLSWIDPNSPNWPLNAQRERNVAISYTNIGRVHEAKGEYDKGLEYFQKALFFDLKHLISWHKTDSQSGRDRFPGQIPGQRMGPFADDYNNIGRMHNSKGEYDEALDHLQRASVFLRADQTKGATFSGAMIKNSIGEVFRNKGEYDSALINLQLSLKILTHMWGRSRSLGLGPVYDNIGLTQLGLGNPTAALSVARDARALRDKRLAYMLSFTSERERLAYQKQQTPFDLLGTMMYSTLGGTSDLAKAVLHNKGIVLSSLLEDQLAAQASSDPKIKELVSQLRTASRQLNKLEMENLGDDSEASWQAHRTKREAARTKAEALQKQLTVAVTGLGEARASLSLTLKDVQGKLAKNAALVEYIIYKHYQGKDQFEESYGAIILPKTGEPKWVPLGSTEGINQLLSKYSPLKPTDDEVYEKVLRGLHDKLMGPVLKQLPKGTKTLILCPDGPLNFLSFATLLTEEDTFLCEEYTLKYVSSGRDMVKEFTPSQGSLAVYANPAYTEEPVQLAGANGAGVTLRSVDRDELRGGLQFKALPGTQKEADYLKDKTTDWKLEPEIYVGKAATEAAISGVKSPRILHLATHGFFLPNPEGVKDKQTPVGMQLGGEQKYRGRLINPMHRSGLAFAGAQKTLDAWDKGETPSTHNDGILTAAEASVLDLKGTWLVTLSACETGRGEARSGEGVLGLRRAFIQAGAQNLLMTLWPVSDKQTIPFMKEFYERAMTGGDAPESLSRVQTERLVKLRDVLGTRLAVQFAGPFIMSFQGPK